MWRCLSVGWVVVGCAAVAGWVGARPPHTHAHNHTPTLTHTRTQLRDDLLSMLVAGHETTGSALTWTLYLLATNPDTMAAAQARAGWGWGLESQAVCACQARCRGSCAALSERLPHPTPAALALTPPVTTRAGGGGPRAGGR